MGLPEFLARYGGTNLEDFVSEVRVPHLVFPAQPDERSRLGFMTTRASLKERESIEDAGSIGLFPLPTDPGRLAAIGRSAGNDLVIRTGEVSKVHCFLQSQDSDWRIKDAESANGTSLNGEKVGGEWVALKDGDVVLLAGFLEIHCLAPTSLYSLLQGLRSADAPARDVPRLAARSRRYLAVVGEGELRDQLASIVATVGGEFHASRLWSDVAPLIWAAEVGDVVLCEPVMYGLRTHEFCRIVARHKPEVELILIGQDSSLDPAVTQVSRGALRQTLKERAR